MNICNNYRCHFVNNIVLAKFLGICPFVGVSNKISTSVGMGGAVLFVMTIATIVTWLIQIYILVPFGIGFLQTIAYILVIASLVQMVEIILKKVSPALYQALGVFLPLITTNCAVLGVAILAVQNDFNLLEALCLPCRMQQALPWPCDLQASASTST